MDLRGLINGILLIIALTTDSFVVSFAYGMGKMKMPFPIVAGMNLIMSSLLGTAVLAGNFLSSVLSKSMTSWMGIILLIGIGLYRILQFFIKKEEKEEIVQRDMTAAEGFILAFVLSLDSLAVGLGTGLVQSGELLLVGVSFVGGIFMMEAGWHIGYRIRMTRKQDLSWISGVCLLLLALGFLWRQ